MFNLRKERDFCVIPTSCCWHLVQDFAKICLLKQAWTDKFCQILAEREGFLRRCAPNNPQSADGILCKEKQTCLLKQAWTDKFCQILAEREGFEPPVRFRTSVFKTDAIDHSAIFPSRERRLNTNRNKVAHGNFRLAPALRSEYRFASIPPELT